MIDEPVPVLVNHVERLLELLDLVLIEHGKDVGCCALGTFLGARASGRFTARHRGGLSPLTNQDQKENRRLERIKHQISEFFFLRAINELKLYFLLGGGVQILGKVLAYFL